MDYFHAVDMSTGNYVSAGFMVDDNSHKMGEFFRAQPYAERIEAAFAHATKLGWRWRIRSTSKRTSSMINPMAFNSNLP